MKTVRNYALIMLAIAAFCVWADPARAQSREVRMLLADQGWHGVSGGVQAHQPTLEFRAPWVSVWERSQRGDRYGEWTYVQVVMNCATWSQMPLAILGADQRVALIAELTGEPPAARWPEPDTTPYRVMTAVCALYGYERRPLNVTTPAPPDGNPYVGGIQRLDKP